MLSFKKLSIAAVGVMLAAASAANATVKYEFTALSSFDGVTGSFTYTAPDFITDVRLIVPAASLDSCVIITSGTQTCAQSQQFFADSKRFFGGNLNADLVAFTGNAISYYFDLGAFQTVGLHQTLPFFGAAQAGTLRVSQAGAVPEPASWALMISGFGMVGFSMRRRTAQIAAVAG